VHFPRKAPSAWQKESVDGACRSIACFSENRAEHKCRLQSEVLEQAVSAVTTALLMIRMVSVEMRTISRGKNIVFFKHNKLIVGLLHLFVNNVYRLYQHGFVTCHILQYQAPSVS
jgi:hypothetical protein